MKDQQIRAFMPERIAMLGKEELPCPAFYNDLAVLDPAADYAVLASRGLFLKSHKPLSLPREEQRFAASALSNGQTAAVLSPHGVLLLFGQLYAATELIPAILPHEDAPLAAEALRLWNGGPILSPAVIAIARHGTELLDVYQRITDAAEEANSIFCPPSNFDFRLHCAHVARLAGCKINVRQLPIGYFPITEADRARWTAFCLCCFLALRGDSADGPVFRLEEATLEAFRPVMEHHSEYRRKIPVENTAFGFLNRPCFREFTLIRHPEGGFSVEAVLRRRSHSSTLSADSDGDCGRISLRFSEES